MKSILLTTAAILLLAAVGVTAAAPPTVDEILDRYMEAAGGRNALEKLKSRTMKGEIEVGAIGLSGPFQVWSKAPNKQVSKLEFGGFGAIREGYDGTVAWAEAPITGLRIKSGGELARVQRTTSFPRELKIRESYARLEAKGAAKVGDLDVWVIEASPKEGKPDRLAFDQKTGLLVQEESTVETSAGDMTFLVELGDYRDVDGIKVPFSMKVPKPAEMVFQIKFNEVKHNVEVADAEFTKPKE